MTYDKERYANDPHYRGVRQKAARRYRAANKLEINARKRASYAADPRPPDVARRNWLSQTYGITPEIYEAMVARQKGLCVLCRRRPVKRLQVDHSHDTRKLRQLLCLGCNTRLGSFGDDPDLMRTGADYLDIWRIIHSWRGPASIKPIPKKRSNKKKSNKGRPTSGRPNPRKEENHMTSGITPRANNKVARLMRQAILRELQNPPSDPEAPAANGLEQIARSLVNKLAQGDASAIKELIERIDVKRSGVPKAMTASPPKHLMRPPK